MSPMNAKDAESPENANDEAMEWSEDIDKTPAEIWEKVENDDDVVHIDTIKSEHVQKFMKPTIDAFGVRGEVTFPAEEALCAETPKVPSKDCWV